MKLPIQTLLWVLGLATCLPLSQSLALAGQALELSTTASFPALEASGESPEEAPDAVPGEAPVETSTSTSTETETETPAAAEALTTEAATLPPVFVACPAEAIAQEATVAAQGSLVERFAPPLLAELAAASCPESLDGVGRELLLAALVRAETLEDPSAQITVLMELATSYQQRQLPQTLPLLDYLLEQSQGLEDAEAKLSFTVAIAHQYASFRQDETATPRETATMALAAQQILQLHFDGTGDALASGNLYEVAQWYSQQGDLAMARQLVSHVGEEFERVAYRDQLEEEYAHALEEQGNAAAADRHRRENLSPERQAPYAEAKAYEQMIAFAEALPQTGEAIDQEMLKQLQKNVGKLKVDWAKYTYGQMVARQLIISGQYQAALETLAQAPVPQMSDDETEYYAAMEEAAAAEEAAEEAAAAEAEGEDPPAIGEAATVPALPIDLGFDTARLLPALLATDVAADGYVDEALAFIDSLPAEDETRLLQRAILLSGISVFHSESQSSGASILADGSKADSSKGDQPQTERSNVYLEEAIAIAEDLPQQPASASLWFLISMAQRWHSDTAAAEQSLDRAIAIAPELAPAKAEIQTELEKEPWILDETIVAASEDYGALREFYEALEKDDLEAAEAALAKASDSYLIISMQSVLSAAYSKLDQSDRATQLLVELFDQRDSEELLENFGEEIYLLQNMVAAFASTNGHITVLRQALKTLPDAEQQRELLASALEVYSYSQVAEPIALPELLARRDAVLALPEETEGRELMLRGLVLTLAQQGAMAEAIALLPEFDLENQARGLMAIADLYSIQAEKPETAVRQQLEAQVRNLAIPLDQAPDEAAADLAG